MGIPPYLAEGDELLAFDWDLLVREEDFVLVPDPLAGKRQQQEAEKEFENRYNELWQQLNHPGLVRYIQSEEWVDENKDTDFIQNIIFFYSESKEIFLFELKQKEQEPGSCVAIYTLLVYLLIQLNEKKIKIAEFQEFVNRFSFHHMELLSLMADVVCPIYYRQTSSEGQLDFDSIFDSCNDFWKSNDLTNLPLFPFFNLLSLVALIDTPASMADTDELSRQSQIFTILKDKQIAVDETRTELSEPQARKDILKLIMNSYHPESLTTILHLVCLLSKNPYILALLIECGAEIDARAVGGNTALHFLAVRNTESCDSKALQLLWDRGARFYENCHSVSPLSCYKMMGNEVLLNYARDHLLKETSPSQAANFYFLTEGLSAGDKHYFARGWNSVYKEIMVNHPQLRVVFQTVQETLNMIPIFMNGQDASLGSKAIDTIGRNLDETEQMLVRKGWDHLFQKVTQLDSKLQESFRKVNEVLRQTAIWDKGKGIMREEEAHPPKRVKCVLFEEIIRA